MDLASIVQGDFCRDRQARHMCLLVSNYATAATKRALKMQVVQRLRYRLSRSCTFLPALPGRLVVGRSASKFRFRKHP